MHIHTKQRNPEYMKGEIDRITITIGDVTT